MTDGRKEKKMQKKKSVSITSGSIVLFLHERHQQYFSSIKRGYKPFFLPPSVCSRNAIKAYFRDRYGLGLSVRPAHALGRIQEKRYVLVNAQILSGQVSFKAFPKKASIEYNKIIQII